MRWRADHDKYVLLANFARRGWTRATVREAAATKLANRDPCYGMLTRVNCITQDDSDWNVYWASPQGTKAVFSAESSMRLADGQVISHFPNHYELTRKDLMVKNLKRYRKELERTLIERSEVITGGSLGSCNTSSNGSGNGAHGSGSTSTMAPELDIIPTTFILPNDFSLFVEEYKKSPSLMWIMKPTSKSQVKL